MNTRIGVLSDTHCPEFVEELPPHMFQLLEGVDLILHAGDVTGAGTLSRLERIAPVCAVRGDHDAELGELPRRRVVEIGGTRIGLVHGNRSRLIEEPVTFLGTVSLGYVYPLAGLDRWLGGLFPGVNVVVHGHTHKPEIRRRGDTLLINPGAVYQVTPTAARARLRARPNWFEWSWLQVARHRRRNYPPSIGMLEIRRGVVAASIVPL